MSSEDEKYIIMINRVEILEEYMIVKDNTSMDIGNVIDIKRFSTLTKLLWVTSYTLRFIENCKRKGNSARSGEINEIDESTEIWMKHEQGNIISNERYMIKLNIPLEHIWMTMDSCD